MKSRNSSYSVAQRSETLKACVLMVGSAFAFAVALPQLGVLLMGLVVVLAGFFDIRQGRLRGGLIQIGFGLGLCILAWVIPVWVYALLQIAGPGLNWLVSLSMMRDVMRGVKSGDK